MITCVSPKAVICHSYESPICPNTISFTFTVFFSCSAEVTSSRWAILSSSAASPFCATGILSACTEADNNNPHTSNTPVSMLRNCFIFLFHFLFQLPVSFKSEEKPRVINQIYQIVRDKRQQEFFRFFTHGNAIYQHHNDRSKHSHNAHQQVYLQHPPRHPVTAAFDHAYHKHTENQEENRYQRITAKIVMREYRIISPTAYTAYQYR